MKVRVYVEGPSDRDAVKALIGDFLETKRQQGVDVGLLPAPEGDKKKVFLSKIPKKAANILRNDPHSIVAAMPDLYPSKGGEPLKTFEGMEREIRRVFLQALGAQANDTRITERFKVFCFKHDVESLVLAAEEQLATRLETKRLQVFWTKPVEDQNHEDPPKRVVERLFRQHGKTYVATVDAPQILSGASFNTIYDRCPQHFKPFIDFLSSLASEPVT